MKIEYQLNKIRCTVQEIYLDAIRNHIDSFGQDLANNIESGRTYNGIVPRETVERRFEFIIMLVSGTERGDRGAMAGIWRPVLTLVLLLATMQAPTT